MQLFNTKTLKIAKKSIKTKKVAPFILGTTLLLSDCRVIAMRLHRKSYLITM